MTALFPQPRESTLTVEYTATGDRQFVEVIELDPKPITGANKPWRSPQISPDLDKRRLVILAGPSEIDRPECEGSGGDQKARGAAEVAGSFPSSQKSLEREDPVEVY